jgi:hypothetical protein
MFLAGLWALSLVLAGCGGGNSDGAREETSAPAPESTAEGDGASTADGPSEEDIRAACEAVAEAQAAESSSVDSTEGCLIVCRQDVSPGSTCEGLLTAYDVPVPGQQASGDGLTKSDVIPYNTCQELLVTVQEASDLLGLAFVDAAADDSSGVNFGCKYTTADYESGGGTLTVDVSPQSDPPPPLRRGPVEVTVGDHAGLWQASSPSSLEGPILQVEGKGAIVRLWLAGVKAEESLGYGDAPLDELTAVAETVMANL